MTILHGCTHLRGQSCEVLPLFCLWWVTVWNHSKSGVGNCQTITLVNVKLVPPAIDCVLFFFEGWGDLSSNWVFSYSLHYHDPYVLPCCRYVDWYQMPVDTINDWYHIWIRIREFKFRERPVCFSAFLCMWLTIVKVWRWLYAVTDWLCCDVISVAARGSCESKVSWKPAGLDVTVVKISRVPWNWGPVMATWDYPD